MNYLTILRRLPFWTALLAVYFLWPLFDESTGGRFLQLVGFLPGLTFILCWLHGLVNGFDWTLCTAAALLAFPVIFLYFDGSVWFFGLIYGAVAFLACFLGGLWRKKAD